MCNCKKDNGQLITTIAGKKIVAACLGCINLQGSLCKLRGACTCSMPICPISKWGSSYNRWAMP